MPWKRKSSKEIYREKWLWITEDSFVLGPGEKRKHVVIHKEPFASIIPWDGKKFILVGQYRYVIDFFSWEFPAGHFQSSILETAIAELKEETGYTAEKIQPLGFTYLAPGHHTQQCHVFLATDLRKGKTKCDIGEIASGMKIKKVTPAELEKMIKTGKIKDGPTLAGYALLQSQGFLKKICHQK